MSRKTAYLAIATPMNWNNVMDRYKYVTVHPDAIDLDLSWVPRFAIE